VTSFYQKYADEAKLHPDFWVLYSLTTDGSEQFFILTHGELARVQAERNRPGQVLSWAECAQAAAGGVDNVLAKDLGDYMSHWDKIVDYCSAKPL
jgi:hypothetical protein